MGNGPSLVAVSWRVITLWGLLLLGLLIFLIIKIMVTWSSPLFLKLKVAAEKSASGRKKKLKRQNDQRRTV